MDSLLQDLRYGVRTWLRHPGFAAVVALTLALGIGATTAIFSVINSTLLRPLPYPKHFELCVLRTHLPEQGRNSPTSSAPEFVDYREQARSFSSLGAIWHRPGALTDDDTEPEEIDMGFVSAAFLDTIGVGPALGRFIQSEEDVTNAPPVIVLSYDIWNRRYGADRDIIGKRIEFDGVAHTVVGVMPTGFRMLFPPDAGVPTELDAWVPWGGDYDQYPRTWRVLTLLGRLATGVSLTEARAEMHTIANRLQGEYPEDYEGSGLDIDVQPLHHDVVAHVRPMLLLLFGAVAFVMLIACANVANLFLVRATATEREMSIRTALGAGRGRLLRQLIAESAIHSFAGAVLGLVCAHWGLDALLLIDPGELPRFEEIAIDGRVLGFGLLAGVVTSLLFGAVSVLHITRSSRTASLQVRARTVGDTGRHRLRGLLVVGELSLSLVLLIGAGLLMRSFVSLSAVDPGFDPTHVQTVKLSLVDSHFRYRDPDKIARFYRQLDQNISELAGIEAVGATTELPLEGRAFRLAPYAYETPEGVVEWESVAAHYRTVTPGWFEAMKARLAAGRFFEWTDDLDHPNVVIIDDKLAHLVWPGRDPIGQRLQVEIFLNGEWGPVWAEVIGVVEHLHHHPGRVGTEQIYLPHQQSPQRTMTLAIRTTLDERTLIDVVKKEVRVLASFQPVHAVRAMQEYFDESLAHTRFTLLTLALFAAMALALASVGIYGVIAFTVSQRTQEIGIRIALGATPGKIFKSFLGESMVLTAAGLALGLAGAVALTRTLSSLLYGISATDPATFFGISMFLTAVAAAAGYLPARRAAKVDPMTSLRQE